MTKRSVRNTTQLARVGEWLRTGGQAEGEESF